MLEFPAQELRKYFKMGDHVKVIAGRFEGDTGLIVRVEENFVILFSDLTMHEVAEGWTPLRLCQKEPCSGENTCCLLSTDYGAHAGKTFSVFWGGGCFCLFSAIPMGYPGQRSKLRPHGY